LKKLERRKQELARLQKENERAREQAQEKEEKAQEALKKLQGLLKGVMNNLRSPRIKDRLASARVLANLDKELRPPQTGYEICRAIAQEPDQGVKRALLEALEKAEPQLFPHAVSLSMPMPQVLDAWGRVEELGEKGAPLAPIIQAQFMFLIAKMERSSPDPKGPILDALRACLAMQALVKVAPHDPATTALTCRAILARFPPVEGKFISEYDGFYKLSTGFLVQICKTRKEAAKQAVPTLMTLLKHDRPFVVLTAAKQLGRIGPEAKAAAPALRDLRFHSDAGIRSAATEALRLIGD
jgi:hypothetical protein